MKLHPIKSIRHERLQVIQHKVAVRLSFCQFILSGGFCILSSCVVLFIQPLFDLTGDFFPVCDLIYNLSYFMLRSETDYRNVLRYLHKNSYSVISRNLAEFAGFSVATRVVWRVKDLEPGLLYNVSNNKNISILKAIVIPIIFICIFGDQDINF